jgi:phosphatidylglycerophosphatase A
MPHQTCHQHQQRLDWVATWIAMGGYSGYVRIVPATIGSFVGLLLYSLLAKGPGRKLVKTKDARPIVIDEVVGMWVALLFLPYRIGYLLSAFVLFRLFDILKPFPADHTQRLRGGLGIMVDDIIAGIYASAILHSIQIFFG